MFATAVKGVKTTFRSNCSNAPLYPFLLPADRYRGQREGWREDDVEGRS